MEIKTDKQHLIDVRNGVARRIVENRANLEYWKHIAKIAKKNSQEIVDANKNIEINEEKIMKDMVFLKCIDSMLKKEK